MFISQAPKKDKVPPPSSKPAKSGGGKQKKKVRFLHCFIFKCNLYFVFIRFSKCSISLFYLCRVFAEFDLGLLD